MEASFTYRKINMTAATSLILHGVSVSGHVHRVELLLRLLGLPYTLVAPPADDKAKADFVARLNPYGQIPVLEDGDTILNDSTAILVYLSKRYDPEGRWLPNDPLGAAAVQRWLSLASGELAFGPAALRARALWNKPCDPARAEVVSARLMKFMERHLEQHTYLAADHATIADLACYGYLAHAPEGGVGLQDYPALRAWLARIEALPGFVPMPDSPLPAAS